MEEYCPRCRKLGKNTKIEQMQINKTESIRMCPLFDECPWPFGYEKIKIIPRDWMEVPYRRRKRERTGKMMDETKKQETKAIEYQLNLYTPPVTPNADGSLKIDNTITNNSSKYTSSIIPSSKKKLKRLEPSKTKPSIFDLDESELAAKLAKPGLANSGSSNRDNTSSKISKLKRKASSNKSGRCDITVKEVKKSRINIQEPIVDSTEKDKIGFRKKKLKKKSVDGSSETKCASTIKENQEVVRLIDSVPKINDDDSTSKQSENNVTVAEANCDLSELDRIIEGDFNEYDLGAAIDDLSSITAAGTGTTGNLDNYAIDSGVDFSGNDSLNFDDSLVSNDIDWLSSWLT